MAFWVRGDASSPHFDGGQQGLVHTGLSIPPQQLPLTPTRTPAHRQQDVDIHQPQPLSSHRLQHHQLSHRHYHRPPLQRHAHRIRYQSLQERVYVSQSPSPEPLFSHPLFDRSQSGPSTPLGSHKTVTPFFIIHENKFHVDSGSESESSVLPDSSHQSSRPSSPPIYRVHQTTSVRDQPPSFPLTTSSAAYGDPVLPASPVWNPYAGVALEGPPSGLSASPEPSLGSEGLTGSGQDAVQADKVAAQRVVDHHTAHHRSDTQSKRILRTLIQPKSRAADFRLDDTALESIFSCVNEIFFAGRLSRRVRWEWSQPGADQYERRVTGETAVRMDRHSEGYETLIVLSSPILKDTRYNRRLLISTFIHELIHSYLFITCGFEAARCGGHNDGFRQIAAVIDKWVGQEYLNLQDLEARLEKYEEAEVMPIGQLEVGSEVAIIPTEGQKRGHSAQWRWNKPHAAASTHSPPRRG